jgi:hypothetical protein
MIYALHLLKRLKANELDFVFREGNQFGAPAKRRKPILY